VDIMVNTETEIQAFEAPPMTLQVVLRASDGIVIASDRLVSLQPAFTDRNSKMVVKSQFVCTFAGDDCAKYICTKLAEKVGDSLFENAKVFLDTVNATLKEYGARWHLPATVPRKLIWIQFNRPRFTIWTATYWACIGGFELCENPNSVFAGHDTSPARYFVEHYYQNNPMKFTVAGLKRMAAHVVLTGHIFNPSGVDGLEMVVGDSDGFRFVLPKELQELEDVSRDIHEKNDARFKD
jgi:hypothetical protein